MLVTVEILVQKSALFHGLLDEFDRGDLGRLDVFGVLGLGALQGVAAFHLSDQPPSSPRLSPIKGQPILGQ
jgi:hypothetical protein